MSVGVRISGRELHISLGVAHEWGWYISGEGLTLVLTWLMARGGKPKVSILVKPLELQNYLAPFSKAAK